MNVAYFTRLVQAANEKCTCDNCSPSLYQQCKSHMILVSPEQYLHRPSYTAIPHTHMANSECRFEALQLARKCIEYFDVPESDLNQTQKRAIARFYRNMKAWGGRMRWADGPRAVRRDRMVELLHIFNHIFFFGAIQGFKFIWDINMADNCFGECKHSTADGIAIISMNPVHWDQKGWLQRSEMRGMDRISTLLHEALHGFLGAYTCKCASTYHYSIGNDGHGRAWQLVAAKIEERVPQLLEIPAFLGRFSSLRGGMFPTDKLPSMCDLNSYNLKDNIEG